MPKPPWIREYWRWVHTREPGAYSEQSAFALGYASGFAAQYVHNPSMDLDELQQLTGTWAAETFPHQTPDSVVAHLREEVDELAQSHSAEEAADCLLLLLNHAHQHGYSLLEAAQVKYAINKGRKWGTPEPNGVAHHERER